MIQMATNQVATDRPSAIPAPAATGFLYPLFAPTKLAVNAASTSTASRPSRKTSSALSTTTAPWLRCTPGAVGSGTPSGAVTAFQASAPMAAKATSVHAERRRISFRRSSCSVVGHPAFTCKGDLTGGPQAMSNPNAPARKRFDAVRAASLL